jgi:phage baseplate assembly protein W
MTISFKDVGIKEEERQNDVLTKNRSKVAIGIKTPLEMDPTGKELFLMHFNIKEQIKDNLRNLLLTNHGERVEQHNFGANLLPLTAEYASKDNFDSEAMVRINTAIGRFLPFITPLEFDSRPDRESNDVIGKIRITVIYSVPSLNIQKDQIDLELSVL